MKKLIFIIIVIALGQAMPAQQFVIDHDDYGNRILRRPVIPCTNLNEDLNGEILKSDAYLYPLDDTPAADEYCWELDDGNTVISLCSEKSMVELSEFDDLVAGTWYDARLRIRYGDIWVENCPETFGFELYKVPSTSCCKNGGCEIIVDFDTDPIYCQTINGAERYSWKLTDSQGILEKEFETKKNYFTLQSQNLPIAGYRVYVKARLDKTWGEYEDYCIIDPTRIRLRPVHCPEVVGPGTCIEMHNFEDRFPGSKISYTYILTNSGGDEIIVNKPAGDPDVCFSEADLLAFLEPNSMYWLTGYITIDGNDSPETQLCIFTSESCLNKDMMAPRIATKTTSQFHLEWNEQPGAEYYEIICCDPGNMNCITESSPANNIILNGLTESTNYQISIITHYNNQLFDCTNTLTATTASLPHVTTDTRMLCNEDGYYEFFIHDYNPGLFTYLYSIEAMDVGPTEILSNHLRITIPPEYSQAIVKFTIIEKANGNEIIRQIEMQECKDDCGFISYGGQMYGTEKINGTCWMAENLNIGSMELLDTPLDQDEEINKCCT